MKLIFVISTLVFSLTGLAAKAPKPPKGELLEVVSQTGSLTLLNQNKEEKVVADLKDARVSLESPGIKNLIKSIAGDRRLVLYKNSDQFSFLITRKSFNDKREFTTHQKYTGQKYHVQMKKETKDFKSVVVEKEISCSWTDTTYVLRQTIDSNGNPTTEMVPETTMHWGNQLARVDDQTWLERQNFVIYNDKDQVRMRTEFKSKEYQNVLQELSNCQ